MASMAETLAASSRQNVPSQSQNSNQSQNQQSSTASAGGPNKASIAGKNQPGAGDKGAVPARYEEFLDVEGEIPIEGVELGGMPLLKILKHSTDPLPLSPSQNSSLPTPVDSVGLLLGLDLNGTAEVVDSFPLPGGINGGLGALGGGNDGERTPHAQNLLRHLREVGLIDSPIGIYLTLHSSPLFTTLSSESFNPSSTASTKDSGNLNAAGLIPGSGWLARGVVEMMGRVEGLIGNRDVLGGGKGGGRAVLIVHDAARSSSGDVSLKAYKFSEGFASALRKQRFDTNSLIEHRLVPSSVLTPLKLKTKNSASLSALFTSLSTPTATYSTLSSPSQTAISPNLLPLQNTSTSTLPISLSATLSQLTNLSTESNNLAYQLRQVAREKSRHETAVAKRAEENELRKKQGLNVLPDVAEPTGKKVADPSRLDMLFCLGAVDNAAKGLAAEAGKGIVKAFASG